jgi:hypothetical protein
VAETIEQGMWSNFWRDFKKPLNLTASPSRASF